MNANKNHIIGLGAAGLSWLATRAFAHPRTPPDAASQQQIPPALDVDEHEADMKRIDGPPGRLPPIVTNNGLPFDPDEILQRFAASPRSSSDSSASSGSVTVSASNALDHLRDLMPVYHDDAKYEDNLLSLSSSRCIFYHFLTIICLFLRVDIFVYDVKKESQGDYVTYTIEQSRLHIFRRWFLVHYFLPESVNCHVRTTWIVWNGRVVHQHDCYKNLDITWSVWAPNLWMLMKYPVGVVYRLFLNIAYLFFNTISFVISKLALDSVRSFSSAKSELGILPKPHMQNLRSTIVGSRMYLHNRVACLVICVAAMASGHPIPLADEISNAITRGNTTTAPRLLKDELKGLPNGLVSVLEAVSRAAVDISEVLGVISADYTGHPNQFGDSQLMADVRTDEIILNRLIESECVETAPSEESPNARRAAGSGYSVAFDPLDGSSVFKSNFAVGTILGIWKGSTPVGQTGRDLASAVYAIYGPKTLLVIARPTSETDGTLKVQQFVHVNRHWCLSRDDITIGEAKICAPANFRASADSPQYQALMQHWMENHYSLRYSGAMVMDIHNILTSGGGIYCFPSSALSPTRLRLMYECAPMAYIVEAAGGAAFNEDGPSLDQKIETYDDKSTIFIGSKQLAADCQSRFKSSQT